MSGFVGARRRFLSACLLGGVIGGLSSSIIASRVMAGFIDPLDASSDPVADMNRVAILALARAGDRVVGVGLRGVIVVSDNGGRYWKQVPTPVQSDLTCVFFFDERRGWAAGHDGVILHSDDGGANWRRQLDGRRAGTIFADHYRQRVAAGEDELKPLLEQVEFNFAGGPTLPYLGIHFTSLDNGYAVGSFGMIIVTNDGGRTWRPALERIDNPSFLNLNAITAIDGALYVVGERGTVFRMAGDSQGFAALSTGYDGSFFGIIDGGAGEVLAYGLRGTVYRGRADGTDWERIINPDPLTVVAAVRAPKGDGAILLNTAGTTLAAADGGDALAIANERVKADATDMVMTGDGAAIIASLGGPIRIDATA